MITTVAHIRATISGLRPDTLIEIKDDKVSVLPKKPVVGLNSNSRIDRDQCLKMREDGKSYAEIGNHFGVRREAIYDFLKRLKAANDIR